MRERRNLEIHKRVSTGITPAYAGKTYMRDNHNFSYKDHPRVCGKDNTLEAQIRTKVGSPPRMRERPVQGDQATSLYGITPAYAGKTLVQIQL